MKTLIVVRHAKSSWDDSSLSDHERPLNDRGRRCAPEMGRRLASGGINPDLILASTARRAMDTATLLAQELDYEVAALEPVVELYAASTGDWLACICALPRERDTVIMVGHNPEITDLFNHLAPVDIDNVPTCGMLILNYAVDTWSAIASQQPDSWHYDYPKRSH